MINIIKNFLDMPFYLKPFVLFWPSILLWAFISDVCDERSNRKR